MSTIARPATAERPRGSDVLLADGRIALIRPLLGGDRTELQALHDEAGDDSFRLRFFASGRRTGQRYVEHLVTAGEDTTLSLVAVVGGRLSGVVSAERIDGDAWEVAMLVADREHGHGLGSLLLEHVTALCRNNGIHRLVAEVLPENTAMLRVLLDAGFDTSRRADAGIVTVELSTEATARAVEAADAREAVSEARSLRPLLYPTSVAVLGVRRDAAGLGHAVLRSILDGGFTGRLHVVHPEVAEIGGIRTHSTTRRIPDQVDLAVVAVPAPRLLEAIEDVAAAGVGAAVVITSGMAELGPERADLQRRLVTVARSHDLRLVGPNCMGLMCNDPAVRLNATFTSAVPPPGGLAVASQSGGVGIALLDVARVHGLGVHSFVSLGNKADVSGNDLLAAWVDDPRVNAAAMYLESFGNARKFARFARRFATHKPLLAVVGGRSPGGRRAGTSHTAAAASPTVGIEALFAQAGVIGCTSAEEMARAAMLLAEQPLPTGHRIGVVSNAGGLGVLAVDAADTHGLVVPELSAPVRAVVARHVSLTTGVSNPVDLGAGAAPDQLAGAVRTLLGSDEIDVLLVVLVPTTVAPAQPLVDALAAERASCPQKPVVLVGLGGLGTAPSRSLGSSGLTVFQTVADAVEAIAHAVRYSAWRRTPPEALPARDATRRDSARALAAALVGVEGSEQSTHWLGPADALRMLGPYGLAPVGTVAANADEAVAAATALGFPVAVKTADPNIVHKTDLGLVKVGLRTATEVRAAVEEITAAGAGGGPVLVQPVVRGVEIALGVVRDSGFGPLVMVAAGGTAMAILEDRAFLMPPFSRQDAARAIRSLRVWPLLDGYRGSAPADAHALEDLVLALGDLALDVPALAELDLNPVMCRPEGVVAVDVKVALGGSPAVSEGVPRQLRAPS